MTIQCKRCGLPINEEEAFDGFCLTCNDFMATTTPKFRVLIEHVAVLNKLLQDPQPELSSWCVLYAEHMKFISDYWTQN